MKQVFLLIMATFFSVNLIMAQDNKPAEAMFNQNPEKAQIVTSDIALFWRAYDLAKPENNLIVYREEYLKKGSVGLQEFLRSKIGNSCNLIWCAFVPVWIFYSGMLLTMLLFLLRTISDFHYVGFFKSVTDTNFAYWDTILFSPLCLFIAVVAFLISRYEAK